MIYTVRSPHLSKRPDLVLTQHRTWNLLIKESNVMPTYPNKAVRDPNKSDSIKFFLIFFLHHRSIYISVFKSRESRFRHFPGKFQLKYLVNVDLRYTTTGFATYYFEKLTETATTSHK